MEANQLSTQWPRDARYLAIVLLLLGILGVIVFIKPVFSTVALGFVLAFLFYSPILSFSRRLKNQYGRALGLFYLLVLIVIVLIVVGAGSAIVAAIQGLVEQMPSRIQAFDLPGGVPEIITTGIKSLSNAFGGALISLLGGLANFLVTLVIALFFSALLLLNLNEGRGGMINLVPEHHRSEIRHILANLDKVWVGYMTAQVIYCLILTAGSYVEFALLGVPFPFLMAALTGILSLIPTIGGIISNFVVFIPCVLLGSTRFTEMPPIVFAFLVSFINTLITQISYNFVALPIIGRMVRLPTAAVLIGVLAGVAMGNIMLAFLVIPILSTLVTVGGYLLAKASGREYKPGEELEEGGKDGFFSQLMAEKEPDAVLQKA